MVNVIQIHGNMMDIWLSSMYCFQNLRDLEQCT